MATDSQNRPRGESDPKKKEPTFLNLNDFNTWVTSYRTFWVRRFPNVDKWKNPLALFINSKGGTEVWVEDTQIRFRVEGPKTLYVIVPISYKSELAWLINLLETNRGKLTKRKLLNIIAQAREMAASYP